MDGFDISHWNGVINWKSVPTGPAFVYVKATDGTGGTDPQFGANWSGAALAKIPRGAYHFFRPNQDPLAQAQHFLAVQGKLMQGDLDPVLDVEIDKGVGAVQLAANVRAWLEFIQTHTNRLPVIYTGPGFWRGSMKDSRDFALYPLWTAQYTNAPKPTLFGGWTSWRYWQYTDHGAVKGISGHVDLNRHP